MDGLHDWWHKDCIALSFKQDTAANLGSICESLIFTFGSGYGKNREGYHKTPDFTGQRRKLVGTGEHIFCEYHPNRIIKRRPSSRVDARARGTLAHLERAEAADFQVLPVRQGLADLRRALETLGDPGRALAEGAVILFAGALLLTPGFFTDTVGLLLLLPPVRRALIAAAARRVQMARFTVGTPPPGEARGPRGPEDVIEAIKYLLELQVGSDDAEIDDIDHLGNRRLRTIDELASDELRKGFLKLRRTVQERMSLKDIEDMTPRPST